MGQDGKASKLGVVVGMVLGIVIVCAGEWLGLPRIVVGFAAFVVVYLVVFLIVKLQQRSSPEKKTVQNNAILECLNESFGWNTLPDAEKAEQMLRKAMAEGHPEAIAHLYELLWRKNAPADAWEGYARYMSQAFRGGGFLAGMDSLKASARKGYAPAQFELGTHFQHGQYVESRDTVKADAFRWLKAAADQGYLPAIHNLGFLVQQSIVDPEYGDIYQPMVKGTLVYSQDTISHCTLEGHKLILKAARMGYPPSQHSIGMRYILGGRDLFDHDTHLFETDREEAKKWLQKAADQGFKPAMDDLKKYFPGTV